LCIKLKLKSGFEGKVKKIEGNCKILHYWPKFKSLNFFKPKQKKKKYKKMKMKIKIKEIK